MDEERETNEKMDELFEKFVDADYFGDKLKIFREMKEGMDYHTLGNIAAVLDTAISGKNLNEDIEFIDYALRTAGKYETKRFGR